jgi:hypothetical protein
MYLKQKSPRIQKTCWLTQTKGKGNKDSSNCRTYQFGGYGGINKWDENDWRRERLQFVYLGIIEVSLHY